MADILVKVEQGTLKGKSGTNRKGGQFYSFQGIPYAKPPIGNLRFKAPQDPEPWQDIKDATREGSECFAGHMKITPQGGPGFMVCGSEDCLVLNVYTPEFRETNASKPVMVFIHGGGFTSGSSAADLYGPEFLLCEDIVLVTINYRLGALGFLSIDDTELGVPGNAGLKDVVQALKWVQKNIKQFGGNPDNVTVFGISAGSAAVHYLILSPLAKGLFHKAILQSGVSTNTWGMGNKNSYKDLAKILGCTETEDKNILEFLQSIPVQKIFQGQAMIGELYTPSNLRPFGPVIEKPSPNALISQSPEDVVKSGHYNQVPIIMGCTSSEGLIVEMLAVSKTTCKIAEDNTYLPWFYPIKPDSGKYREAEQKVKKFYFGNTEPEFGTEPYVQLAGDNMFCRELINMAKAHFNNQKAPVYFYIFSADTPLNFSRFMAMIKPKVQGACHADDQTYLFKSCLRTLTPGSLEETIVEKLVKMWTNFARTGNPIDNTQEALKTAVWTPATVDNFSYLDIGSELKLKVDPNKERMQFWDEMSGFAKTS